MFFARRRFYNLAQVDSKDTRDTQGRKSLKCSSSLQSTDPGIPWVILTLLEAESESSKYSTCPRVVPTSATFEWNGNI